MTLATPAGNSFASGTQSGRISILGTMKTANLYTGTGSFNLNLGLSGGNSTIAGTALVRNTGTLSIGTAGLYSLSITNGLNAPSNSNISLYQSITTGTTQAFGGPVALYSDVEIGRAHV